VGTGGAADTLALTDGTRTSYAQATGYVGTPLSIRTYITAGVGISAVLLAFSPVLGSLSQLFSEWRIKNLVCRWAPVLPSTSPGSVAIAIIADGSHVDASTNNTYSSVASTEGSLITPIWSPYSKNVTSLLDCDVDGLPKWKMTDMILVSGSTGYSPGDEANLRQACPGQIQVCTSGTGAAASGVIVGNIVFEGTIEFRHLDTATTH